MLVHFLCSGTPLLHHSVSPPVRVEADQELGRQFKVTYDTGEVAEVSWSFIRELPPGK
jgi:hypothetical protein